jgi:formate dehydrogenase subunit gamma
MTRTVNGALVALALALGLGLSAPVAAQQVNPTEKSVHEEQLLQALQRNDAVAGRITIPDDRAAALIKPDNKGWAALREGTMHTVSLVAFFGMIALLAVFYLVRGRIRIDGGAAGVRMLRFDAIERFAHWLTASTFVVLALTGLNLVLGRMLLQPLIGEAAFGTVTAWGKLGHNYLAWPFMVGVALVFVLWVWHNIPAKIDLEWIAQGGGLFSDDAHPPARKFNAGQKVIFWSTVLGGAALSFTGIMLLFPGYAGGPADWQFYQFLHGAIAAVLAAVIIAHIYIGSVGMEGAFDAMGGGEVDVNWARQHHSLWVKEVEAEERAAARAGAKAMPAE